MNKSFTSLSSKEFIERVYMIQDLRNNDVWDLMTLNEKREWLGMEPIINDAIQVPRYRYFEMRAIINKYQSEHLNKGE